MAQQMKLAQDYRMQHSPNKKTARRAKAVIKAYKREHSQAQQKGV